MKGMMQYEGIEENEVKESLRNYGLKYIRTLKYLKTIVFQYEENEELNSVAMAMNLGKLSGLSLEKKVKTMYKEAAK